MERYGEQKQRWWSAGTIGPYPLACWVEGRTNSRHVGRLKVDDAVDKDGLVEGKGQDGDRSSNLAQLYDDRGKKDRCGQSRQEPCR